MGGAGNFRRWPSERKLGYGGVASKRILESPVLLPLSFCFLDVMIVAKIFYHMSHHSVLYHSKPSDRGLKSLKLCATKPFPLQILVLHRAMPLVLEPVKMVINSIHLKGLLQESLVGG